MTTDELVSIVLGFGPNGGTHREIARAVYVRDGVTPTGAQIRSIGAVLGRLRAQGLIDKVAGKYVSCDFVDHVHEPAQQPMHAAPVPFYLQPPAFNDNSQPAFQASPQQTAVAMLLETWRQQLEFYKAQYAQRQQQPWPPR